MKDNKYKVCIVTDPIVSPIEGLLEDIYKSFDDVHIHTAYLENGIDKGDYRIKQTLVSALPSFLKSDFVLGVAYDSLKLNNYDIVINLSSYTLKRYLGEMIYIYPDVIGGIREKDHIIAPSEHARKDIQNKYKRDSYVLYSPIDVKDILSKTNSKKKENWFLYMAQYYSDDSLRIVIEAASSVKTPIKVLSSDKNDINTMREFVKKLNAKGYIKFLGELDKEKKYDLISRSKAVIHPKKSDNTGYIPMISNASGTAVIAYKEGASLEVLSEDNPKTGVFFDKYNYKSLAKVLKNFDGRKYKNDNCRKQSQNFATEIFRYKLRTYVEDVLQNK